MTTINRPALRYYGGKFRIAPWIVSHFPPHECYCEPFGGAMSVLLHKYPARHEVYNDLDEYLVGYFRVLREQPDALIAALRWTPYSRREFREAWEDKGEPGTLEAARRLYIRAYQGFSNAPNHATTAWRIQAQGDSSAVKQFKSIDGLYALAERMRHVQIECRDAHSVLRDFDTSSTLHYVDPPYVLATRTQRTKSTGYNHEMTDDDHLHLLDTLSSLRGMIIVSGYDTELYRSQLPDWTCVSRRSASLTGASRVEKLWLSPNVLQRSTKPLFTDGAA